MEKGEGNQMETKGRGGGTRKNMGSYGELVFAGVVQIGKSFYCKPTHKQDTSAKGKSQTKLPQILVFFPASFPQLPPHFD